MGLWTDLQEKLTGKPRSVGIIHDFTFSFWGHKVSMVKPLDGGVRAFLTGSGSTMQRGDVVVARPSPSAPKLHYRIEAIQHGKDGTWRAYASVESATKIASVSKRSPRMQLKAAR